MRALVVVLSLVAGSLLAGCARDDNPKVETVTGTQAQETLKHMRKPMGAGGSAPTAPAAGAAQAQ